MDTTLGTLKLLQTLGEELHGAIVTLECAGDRDDTTGVASAASSHYSQLAQLSRCRDEGLLARAAEALEHVQQLEQLLSTSISRAGRRCSVIADALAVREEHCPASGSGMSATAAVHLGRRFRRHSRT